MTDREQRIKEMSDRIRDKMIGVTLMGEPINTEDADELLVAAFGLGEALEGQRARKTIDALMDDWMSI